MSDEHNLPDRDTNDNDSVLDVFLVSMATPDAKRRLAAAIELLLQAGAERSKPTADETETEDGER